METNTILEIVLIVFCLITAFFVLKTVYLIGKVSGMKDTHRLVVNSLLKGLKKHARKTKPNTRNL
mgnify:FL=1